MTDAIAALGLPHGSYSVGETHVVVDDHGARTPEGVLAGSVLRFDDAVRNLMAFTGCDLAEASLAASSTPARLAQRPDIGRLAPGCLADIVRARREPSRRRDGGRTGASSSIRSNAARSTEPTWKS